MGRQRSGERSMQQHQLVCPHCRAILKTESTAGTVISCARCQARMTVPQLAAPETAADIVLGEEAIGDASQGPLSLKGIRSQPLQSITLGDFQILRKLGLGAMGAV